MTIKLSQLVRTPAGEVTTIAALADRGEITFNMVQNFQARASSKPRTAYFADLNSGGCWEISRLAYLSRTNQKIEIA